MFARDEKLKKLSDGVFQEAQPPEDRKRPLEWRRSFNFIRLPLKNIEIINSCTVHDKDLTLDEEKTANQIDLIKPDITATTLLAGILDEDRVRDSIYCAVANKEEEEIYSIERPGGTTKITLKSGEPTEAGENTPAGLYWGNAFRMNYEPGEDDLIFELRIPENIISSLIASLRADENSSLEIGVYLHSFTYEVDDFLREPYHPQEIVMNEMTPCFIVWAQVTTKVGRHYNQVENDEEETNDVYQEELAPEQRSHQELMQILLSYSTPLNSLMIAAWVLIIVIVLHAFFN